ncbi:signal peptide peptidase SppA [Vibrio agarivorans]|uniref:Signal peptide peptidase SppA n=1 Tax=Vibrio agarivorans TaxID=153622 RepID=A0ABT7Y0H2_9VIBR|nr:signal peptide peptidase SppA [Vibrio agarivorans]MDN2481487.1 signal peptide peptidase SppA [Vibrio agarivorans]
MKTLFKFIGMIFKGFWKAITFIRMALANLLFLVFIAVLFFTFKQAEQVTALPEVKKESALIVNISGPIVEERSYLNPMDSITGSLLGSEMPRENVLFDIVDTIRHAQDDPQITGIVLALNEMPETNLTKLRYIAKALTEFRTSGKPVYAAGGMYNQSQYYLASYADKIFLSPDGGVMLKGYSAYNLYYKALLEKLDVNTHVFRVGTYKSAIEPFTRDDMSSEAKEAASRWLSQMWGAYVDDVASNRDIKPEALNPSMEEFLALMKEVNGDVAALALKIGLVDELATRQEIRAQMADVFGAKGKDSYNAIGFYEYQNTFFNDYSSASDDIAVVVVSGAIMDGRQQRNTVGGDTTAALLRQARNDDDVKAVVLRVDSPGGSAFASEVIRHEVVALREAGKPVVVSMSSLAASGGYWVSMSADKIIAQPTTLTGSIGVFSVITTFEKGLDNIGVNTDGIGTSPFSGVGVTTGLSDGASQAIQLGVEHAYNRFTGLVAEGRNIDINEMEKIAEGRVWTGQDAMNLGLVDEMGDFDDALAAAAKLAELDDYNVHWVQEPLSPVQQFLNEMFNHVSIAAFEHFNVSLPSAITPITEQMTQDATLLNSFNDPKGHYALCLNCNLL